MNGRLRNPGIDRILMLAVLCLLVLGTLLVWSATSHRDDLTGGDPTAYLRKQLVNVCIGLVLMVVVMATDHRWVRIVAPVVYLASIGGLVLVLTMGTTINGSRSWIDLAGMSIQPSEFAKLAVVIGMALLVAERNEGRRTRVGTAEVVGMLVIAGVPAALIMLQPDLGTLLVLSATVFGVLAVAGAPRRWLALLLAGGVAGGVAVLAGRSAQAVPDRPLPGLHQPRPRPARRRATTPSRPGSPIGNGGLFGQGLFHGSQTRAGFVPEQHTDFIFTVAGEELGLVGAGVLIALLGVVHLARPGDRRRADDLFGRRRRGRHRLLVRLPGLPEHRDVPGDHAGDRRTPAVRVVRRIVDVRGDAGHRAAPEHPPARHGVPAHPLRPPGPAGTPGRPLSPPAAITGG